MLAMRHWSVRHAALLERGYAVFERTMLALRPLARVIGARRLARPVTRAERAVKGFLFDCRMCGNCVLSQNGMACPMNCPKGVRNGPCGGVRADGTCEAKPGMRCVGLEAWHGAARMSARHLPLQPTAPAENQQAGRSTWMPLLFADLAATPGGADPQRAPSAAERQPVVDASVVVSIAPVPAPASDLQALLDSGTFAVTAELAPPDSADPADVLARLEPFRGHVDALNVTDASGANCHTSSLATSLLLLQAGCEPVLQMACRDRNRIALQGDLLGAAALGLRNVLCLTGDHVANGDHPGARHVGDLDSVTLLATARKMRDAGEFLSGRKLAAAPRLFLGAAGNPFAAGPDVRLDRLRRKVAAGAQFVQTQYCFDLDALEHFMQRVRDEGLDEDVHILVGVGPIVSAKTARWLRGNVPGVRIPDAVVQRLERAADPREEGRRLCIELIRGIRGISGVAGVHIMAYRQERMLASIVAESGVLGTRRPLFAAPAAEAESALA
jgi:5,10-methylenetetrahydrofolate reductase